MRALPVLVVAGLLVAAVATHGLFLSRDWLFAWALAFLVALSLPDPRRWLARLLPDWLPLMALLLVYDLSTPARQALGIVPHVLPQLQADVLLPGEQVPTVMLQRALHVVGEAHWYDYATFAVYLSHFFVTLTVGIVLWRTAWPRFREFRALVVVLASAGFATYVLFPAVPPWMAALDGHLPAVARTVGEMWAHVGLGPAAALFERPEVFYNDVAALPSLHAAYPVALLLFFWPSGPAVRAGLALYAVAMGFTLVYTGEHYVSDVVVGWAYAGIAHAGLLAARRWRAAPSRGMRAPARQPAPEAARAA